jgi:NMD protein affecting ribosome stability and mRNA decay
MNNPVRMNVRRLHRHRPVTTHVLGQRAGVPYELERHVCKTCGRELSVKQLKRAAAA